MLQTFRSKYKVQGKIGEGSFSEVLKCQDKNSGVCIAAKHLKKCFKSALHAAELPELIALRKLARHPNILHMIESHYETNTGRVTFIFELMDMSLYDMMKNRKRPIPESRAKNYLYQVVKGVAHIHHHGIFHRDIKPENILVKGELLKISDLGSVKGIYTRHPYTEYISTRWYRSPECLLTTGYYGPKMDVWAIGCVFFELITLKPLFPGSSELDQIAKINAVLGSPNARLLAKFTKHKCRNISVCFPAKQGSGLNQLLPFITTGGRDVLKQMIVYDPDSRSNIRRLSEHKYFLDIRDSYIKLTDHLNAQIPNPSNLKITYRNPALLSYLTTERKRKIKKKVTNTNTSKLNATATANHKITEAKRNALLQQKLQQKQQELQHQEQVERKQLNLPLPSKLKLKGAKIAALKPEANEKTEKLKKPPRPTPLDIQEQMVGFKLNKGTLENLKDRLNAPQNHLSAREQAKEYYSKGDNSENPFNETMFRNNFFRLPPITRAKPSLKAAQEKSSNKSKIKSMLPPISQTNSQLAPIGRKK
ncbi:MAPK/MAK/MRK overlapping kinase-like isoform X3 [Rhodnius prolixus]|uniref:MAPK/MAK/MRK overlapping kinase-like isoform X3 n=1 Tax=Rhodnius prolixus TaxID=13249 RepID=UPI003D18BB85